MSKMSAAVVQVEPGKLELREFPIPTNGTDDALLRVERCGVCGTDVELYDGALSWWVNDPIIPGHEPVGIIEEIGAVAARRWGLERGDRVVVESAVPCLSCRYCSRGQFSVCPNRKNIGFNPIDDEPALWGGFAEYLYLPPTAQLHKIANSVPVDVASLFNPLTCGIAWAAGVPHTGLGDVVVVLGCGQRGIACALAAKAAGAKTTLITGLNRDARKLELALELGVDRAVNVEQHDLRESVAECTDGEGADVVVDVVPFAASTLLDAVALARVGGTIVLAGIKGDAVIEGLRPDTISRKALRIEGVWGKTSEHYEQAVALLEGGRFPMERLITHTFGLTEVDQAIEVLSGRRPGEQAVFIGIDPGLGR